MSHRFSLLPPSAGDKLLAAASRATITLSRYGVDAANNVVWAVLDHNSDFAVLVPEPAGLAALALAAMAGLTRMPRRHRRHQDAR